MKKRMQLVLLLALVQVILICIATGNFTFTPATLEAGCSGPRVFVSVVERWQAYRLFDKCMSVPVLFILLGFPWGAVRMSEWASVWKSGKSTCSPSSCSLSYTDLSPEPRSNQGKRLNERYRLTVS